MSSLRRTSPGGWYPRISTCYVPSETSHANENRKEPFAADGRRIRKTTPQRANHPASTAVVRRGGPVFKPSPHIKRAGVMERAERHQAIRRRNRQEGVSGMVGKYRVITLCGSTRFKEAFLEAQKRLTLEGNIVISVGLFGHAGDDEVWTEGTKEMLDDMHKRKIDMADGFFVLNVGGYIGSSTKSEIEYALAAGKAVSYLEDPESGGKGGGG